MIYLDKPTRLNKVWGSARKDNNLKKKIDKKRRYKKKINSFMSILISL